MILTSWLYDLTHAGQSVDDVLAQTVDGQPQQVGLHKVEQVDALGLLELRELSLHQTRVFVAYAKFEDR